MKVCIVVLLSSVLTLSVIAQDKAPKAANVQGTVKAIKKETSTISVDTGKTQRQVMSSASTKFMVGHSKDNKAGSMEKVNLGNYISCTGAMDKGVLMATQCLYRDSK